jgi:hypothetical protein
VDCAFRDNGHAGYLGEAPRTGVKQTTAWAAICHPPELTRLGWAAHALDMDGVTAQNKRGQGPQARPAGEPGDRGAGGQRPTAQDQALARSYFDRWWPTQQPRQARNYRRDAYE